jgi:hypothetical protein
MIKLVAVDRDLRQRSVKHEPPRCNPHARNNRNNFKKR